jgi:hypothetical protein
LIANPASLQLLLGLANGLVYAFDVFARDPVRSGSPKWSLALGVELSPIKCSAFD